MISSSAVARIAASSSKRLHQHHHANIASRAVSVCLGSSTSSRVVLEEEGTTTATPLFFPTKTTTTTARYYSTTIPLGKKKDDDDDEEEGMIQMSDDSMTEEEARQIIAEEIEYMEKEEKDKYAVQPEDWKPGMRKRKIVIGTDLEEIERDMDPDRFTPKWTLRDKRCGLLAIKVGMMPIWDPNWGERFACTVLSVDTNIVLGHKTLERDGYLAVRVAAGERKRKNVGKSVLGQYQHILDEEENPPYLVREFRVTSPDHLIEVGSQIHARHFVPGQNVDISGISKGKGFQGGMKLHGFGGQPASHGVSKSHRALGSIGQCQDPGRVFKGKKMPGRMGTNRVTVQNLRIVKIDRGRNLIYIKGHIPGQKGNWVEIRDAVKKPLWNTDLVEGALDRPPLPTYPYDQDFISIEDEAAMAAAEDLEAEQDNDDAMKMIIDGSGHLGYEVFMPIGKEDPFDPDYRNSVTQLKPDE